MAKNNKMIGLAATAALLVVAVVAGTYPSWKSTPVVSGEYTGSAKGMGGDVTVTLTIEDNHITDVTAEGKDETKGLGDKAVAKLAEAMKEGATVDVETVSGATISSNATIEAAKAALTSAGLKAEDLK